MEPWLDAERADAGLLLLLLLLATRASLIIVIIIIIADSGSVEGACGSSVGASCCNRKHTQVGRTSMLRNAARVLILRLLTLHPLICILYATINNGRIGHDLVAHRVLDVYKNTDA